MEKHSKFQEIISVWMIFVVLACLPGCYSYRSISSSDLSSQSFDRYLYLVHNQGLKYAIDSVVVFNGTLSGRINYSEDYLQRNNKIHIYLSSDSVMEINSENILITPIDNITQVKTENFLVVNTIGILSVVAIVTVIIVSLVKWSKAGSWINPNWNI